MFKVTEDDRHNEPTLHLFRDKEHCLQFMKDDCHYLDDDMIEEFSEEGEIEDDNMVTWCTYTGYYTIDHTKE